MENNKVTLEDISNYYKSHPHMVCGVLTSGFFDINEKKQIVNQFLGSIDGKSVIDIGCGDGKLCEILNEMGVGKYVGFDVSSDLIKLAQKKFPQYEFYAHDMHNFSTHLQGGMFDIAFMLDVWEHSINPNLAIMEAKYMLKKGGQMMVSIPNYCNFAGIKKIFKERLGVYPKNSWAPFGNEAQQINERFTTSFSLKRTLMAIGFEICFERGWDLIAGFFPSIYADAALKGFWKKYSHQHYLLNRYSMKNFTSLTSKISMYYLVSAKKSDNFKES